MRRFAIALAMLALACGALAPQASADFGFKDVDLFFANEDGSAATQAGSHPFSVTTSVFFNTAPNPEIGFELPDDDARDIVSLLAPGFIGKPDAVPTCATADFLAGNVNCPASTQVGWNFGHIDEPGEIVENPVYSLTPPPGVPVRLGIRVREIVPVTIDVGVSEDPPYNIVGGLENIPQIIAFYGAELELWGVPADPAHDPERFGPGCNSGCSVNLEEVPFITLPRACEGPLETSFEADSWQNPGAWVEESALTHDDATPPNPQGMTGCGKLPFDPQISSQPTADSAETGTGLDFNLDFADEGIGNPDGVAQSDLRKAVVTLPEGVTINPSIGEGLGVCTPNQLNGETAFSNPGQGCPNASKIGTVHVQTPLIEEAIDGSVYLAQQDDQSTSQPGAENPFDSLIAFYIVLQNRNLGISVKVPAKVEPDPRTGQLVTTVDDIPQTPFSHFNFHFREGQRAPLVTPSACGTYETKAELTPRARPSETLTTTASFQVTRGIGGGPCPPGGVPPFKPRFEAGSINNNAGAFSPFYMRLQRADGEQNMTKFSSVLPPGVLGSLKGVAKCPDAAIEAAKAKTGREELVSPSCPAGSQIGRTLAGAGVGSALTYVGGQIYLGGPYKGKPLSVISVTPAVAGPFDAGTVVVRLALDLNPQTAEVEVDGAASDPIPHILKGIVLKVRDLRVYVDRPNFTLNPTSCDESSAKATLFGSYLDVFSAADDVPVALSSRYQAANCLNLGFKPKLKLSLRGGARRGDNPGLRAVLRPRPGDANIAAAKVTLPRSAFLDQAHIRTICTRVQFAAEECPKGSIYGQAKAVTPLLDEPIEGPVILRSSSNNLPDLVIALKGLVDVNVSSRIDSFKGGIRNTFEVVPDAPVSEFTLTLQGGKRGLIVNSRDLCEGRISRVKARFTGQNGKVATLRPKLQPKCGGKR